MLWEKRAAYSYKFDEKEQRYVCEECSASLVDLGKFFQHVRVHHLYMEGKLCHICGKLFTYFTYLRRHLESHFVQFRCGECDKTFRNEKALSVHVQGQHAQNRPHLCDICSMQFVTAERLKRHLKIHTGEKPYKCGYCDMAFLTKSQLKGHTRIHTGEKPYKCSKCGIGFAQSQNRDKHEKTCRNWNEL